MNILNENARTDDRALSDLDLDAASGGKKEVTQAEYEKILGQMIQAGKESKKGGSSGGHGATGSW